MDPALINSISQSVRDFFHDCISVMNSSCEIKERGAIDRILSLAIFSSSMLYLIKARNKIAAAA